MGRRPAAGKPPYGERIHFYPAHVLEIWMQKTLTLFADAAEWGARKPGLTERTV